MDLATLIVLGFTAAAIIFGMLFGFMRGRNRAFLRLVLVILCVVLSVVLKDTFVSAAMDFDIGGTTINEIINEELMSGEEKLPAQLQDLVYTLMEIIVGLVGFFLMFIVFRIVSWMIIFPIAKIFVRKGKKKGVLFGGFIGAIQGVVIALVICAPVSGIMTQVNKLSEMKVDGEQVLKLPEEIGIQGYVDSTACKVYNTAGGWFFDMISTAEDENGNKISIEDTCDIVNTVAGLADTVTDLTDSLDSMSVAATPQEQVTSIKNVGNSLIEIGNSINGLSGDAKNVVQNVMDSVKDMVAPEGEEIDDALASALDNLDINSLDLVSVGEAMNGIASYIEKTSDEFESTEPVTQEEINDIVNGFANNTFILDIIVSDSSDVPQIIEADDDMKAMFETAVESTSISDEYKESLRKLLGLSVAQ